jgi:hypothetical protein
VDPLPWERLLWSGRPRRLGARIAGTRFVLTDVRLARLTGTRADDIAIHDIAEIHRVRTPLDRLLGTSTLVVDSRHPRAPSLVVAGITRGAQVAALLELLSGDPHAAIDPSHERAIRDALAWEPRLRSGGRGALAGGAAVGVAIAAIVAVAIGVSGHTRPVAYSPLDPIEPGGHKRSRDEIVRFMEADVMPWARTALGPIRGGADRVTCETCHGRDADARGWQMPAVAALPAPVVRELGWERSHLDPQVRNAIYGYLAEADKQTKATYMREVVLPGMATLLHRPAYDFTRPYEENRAHHAFGCYHCHRVK